MTVSDLHPEELLDALERRPLAPHERADLNTHLRRCAGCAAQVKLRADFQSSPTSADDVLAARLTARVLTAAGSPGARVPATGGRTTARRFPLPWAVAAAIVLFASGVGAASAWRPALTIITRVIEPLRAPPPPPAIKRRPDRRAPVVEAPRAVAPAPEAPVVVEPAPAPVARPRVVAAPRVVAVVEPPSPTLAPPPVEPPVTASDLFSSLNRARAGGRRDDVRALAMTLAARFPGSREATTAAVLLGQVELAVDARAALASFERALAADPGPLAEEARLGRAQALDRTVDGPLAADAWRELLVRHPDSAYATLARRRLQELASGRPAR